MSEWWIVVVVVVVLVAAVVLYLRRRDTGVSGDAAGDASRDYGGERETGRLAGMSEEDRTWEAASLKRNRESEEREQPTPDEDRRS